MDQHAIKTAIQALEDAIEGPDLPEPIFEFISRHTPLVCVDLLIQDEDGRTLLTWREDIYFGEGWHLPGGVLRHGESREQRAVAAARGEFGSEIYVDSVPMGSTQYFNRSRTERSHQIVYLVRCQLLTEPNEAMRFSAVGKPRKGQWAWHQCAPAELLPVHEKYRQVINGAPQPNLPASMCVEFDAIYIE